MKAAVARRLGQIILGLAVVAGAGLALKASGQATPDMPTLTTPACDSCTARHARLADLRAQPTEGTE